jgi:magnesium chelatase family protein
MNKVTKVNSLMLNGITAENVSVQIHTSSGIPSFKIVGLADKTIAEAKERVKAALSSIAFALPSQKILINLAPANLAKEGSHFDLPIALGILTHLSVIQENIIKDYIILGEVSLNADILHVAGVLPAAVHASANNQGIICPYDNIQEAQWSGNKKILGAKNLIELINHFNGKTNIDNRVIPTPLEQNIPNNYIDLQDVKGQLLAKRSLQVAAAGGHNLIMSGPPGTGKSMLARSLPSILPNMSSEEILECSMIYSVAGLMSKGILQSQIPFRSPHHSASLPAIVGGGIGKKVKPGEISLAHNGILFLDEFPEFSTSVIDSLRQPMEMREILISRSDAHITYPASFQLIAAMNPCKCGYLGDSDKECNKAPLCSKDYLHKISGPILDRFGLHINVKNETAFETIDEIETSEEVKIKIEKVRSLQKTRFSNTKYKTNALVREDALKPFIELDEKCKNILENAVKKFKLSMRSYMSVIRVARTIADLDNTEKIKEIHIAEALNYRIDSNVPTRH